jgi:peptidyl-prolyl cis-trans isomerase C
MLQHKIIITSLLIALTIGANAQNENASIDLSQTEDLFSNPLQPNPLTNDPEAVVVKVDGMEIKRGEILELVNLTMQRLGGQVPPQQLPQLQQQMYTRVKNDLINAKLIEGAVIAADIPVDDAAIEAEITTIRESLPEGKTLEELLAVQNNTLDELKDDIRNQLASRTLFDQQVANIANATEADAQTFYNENPNNFQTPEQVTASHILVKPAEGADEAAKAASKAELETIRASIIAGETSFAEAAAAHSSCPSSAQGGSLGTFGKGQMVLEFEIAAFTQEIGEVGDIVETQFGYHIIQVSEHTDEGTIAFDEAKTQIIDFLTNQSKQQAIAAYIESLRSKATIEDLTL